ncbi:hypothetical protein [Acidithiobacillus sp.]|uniref:hypothetical protein n=1 Tax=Acidithiobacillus sp. TaxID=1872118 RepID=UPI003D0858FD
MHKQIDKKKCIESMKDLSNVIFLDSGSSIRATFMNPDLVTGIRVAKQPLMMTILSLLSHLSFSYEVGDCRKFFGGKSLCFDGDTCVHGFSVATVAMALKF